MNEIDTLYFYMRAAKSTGCQMFWARKWIRARFERGDFPMIAHLDAAILEAMVRATLKEAA